jgi:hypothetical protein
MSKKRRPTQRAPDWWESARFQAVCVAWSWFRQSGVASSHPPAGNASRWLAVLYELKRNNRLSYTEFKPCGMLSADQLRNIGEKRHNEKSVVRPNAR